jgi:hypothetical protein
MAVKETQVDENLAQRGDGGWAARHDFFQKITMSFILQKTIII